MGNLFVRLENLYLAEKEQWAHVRMGAVAICVYEKDGEQIRNLTEAEFKAKRLNVSDVVEKINRRTGTSIVEKCYLKLPNGVVAISGKDYEVVAGIYMYKLFLQISKADTIKKGNTWAYWMYPISPENVMIQFDESASCEDAWARFLNLYYMRYSGFKEAGQREVQLAYFPNRIEVDAEGKETIDEVHAMNDMLFLQERISEAKKDKDYEKVCFLEEQLEAVGKIFFEKDASVSASKLQYAVNKMQKNHVAEIDRSAIMSEVSRLVNYKNIVANGRVIKERLHGTPEEIADCLYDAAYAYLENRKYKEAEICLNEIVKMNCWENDKTLEPAVYSLFAVLYFNLAVKNHSRIKYKRRDFVKAVDYAKKACDCSTNCGRDFDERTKTGAWQVLFASAVLVGDVVRACELKVENNIFNLVERYRPFGCPDLDWNAFNEIDGYTVESRFNEILKRKLYDDPESFDYLYELHESNRKAVNYTEALAYASTFIPQNYARTVRLYDHLFDNMKLKDTYFQNYLFNQCEKLCAIMYMGDVGEIKRTLKEIEGLVAQNPTEFEASDELYKREFYAVKMYALIAMKDYKEAIRYANHLKDEDCTEQILFCISKALALLGNYDEAKRAGISSLSLEADVFKIVELGKLFSVEKNYVEAIDMYKWALDGLKKEVQKNNLIQGPYGLPSLGKPTKTVQSEVFQYLIDVLLMEDQYGEAERVLAEYGKLKDAVDKETIKQNIEKRRRLYEEKEAVSVENIRISNCLEEKETTIRNMIAVQAQWYEELVRCQVFDESISEDLWDELDLNTKMYKVIEKISAIEIANDKKGYERELEKVRARFPKMAEQAQKYLASAEQMSHVFLNNSLIDCAPVLVEYARVYEYGLWDYLEHTAEYKEHAIYELNKKKGKKTVENEDKKIRTIGKALKVIESVPDGVLTEFVEVIREVNELRIASAHAYISKEPELKRMQDIIGKDNNNLLDILVSC